MRPLAPCVLSAIVFASCHPAPPATPVPPTPAAAPAVTILIRGEVDDGELEAAVGKWVRVKGMVSSRKQPQIAGVDVDTRRDLSDKRAWAEGTLKRQVEGGAVDREHPPQMRSGTFYRLIDPATGHTAVAHPFDRAR